VYYGFQGGFTFTCHATNQRLFDLLKKTSENKLKEYLLKYSDSCKTFSLECHQIVHSFEPGKEDGSLKDFVRQLEEDGVIVRTVVSGSMDCVLKSQLVRLFASDLVQNQDDLVHFKFLFCISVG
jgi:hypothetical protein